MKTKTILHCIVTSHNGTTFENPLMLSEVRLIAQMARENAKVEVSLHTVSESFYKLTFGK